MEELTAFLKSQKILQIAPAAGDPWIANVYMASDTPAEIYFVGSVERLYGQQLTEDDALALATAWSNPENLRDRKGIQAVGTAQLLTDREMIAAGLAIYHDRYPDAKDRLTVDWALSNDSGSGIWLISPSFIKFWNDELYGPEGTKEFTL